VAPAGAGRASAPNSSNARRRIKADGVAADHKTVEAAQRAARYDEAVNAVLPAVSGLLAVVGACLAVGNLFLPDHSIRVFMALLAGGTSLAYFAVCGVLSRYCLPNGWGHPAMAAICLVAAADSAVHMHLGRAAWLTSNMMLILAGSGAALLGVGWLVATLAGVWVVWAVAYYGVGGPQSTHWVLGMLGATVLALVINKTRRGVLDRLLDTLERAERAAVEDDLTGLLNRRGIALVGDQIVASARRAGNAVHCVFLDVDGLKDVNDRLGHAAGDRVLLSVADAVRAAVRSGDVVARWGGDEFCVVGPGPGTAPIDLEKRVAGKIVAMPPADVPGWVPQVSAGSAMLAPWDDGDLASLLDQADREMYRRRGLRRESVPLEHHSSPD
jgi:diguanylate cyclase (GGDEF)-like protein